MKNMHMPPKPETKGDIFRLIGSRRALWKTSLQTHLVSHNPDIKRPPKKKKKPSYDMITFIVQ